jgi:mRNA turnover protein 4
MAKALGTTPEEEHRMGIHKLAQVCNIALIIDHLMNGFLYFSQQIQGQVGLLFTDTEPQEVIEWFADFSQPDFARAGNVATRTVILPAGPVMRVHSDPPEPFPHNEEPQLRRLGLTTTMNRGVPTLTNPHKLCEKGKVLTAEQAQLLKLIGEKMVTFRVGLIARWEAGSGEVIQIDGPRLSTQQGEDDEAEDEDEAMSD